MNWRFHRCHMKTSVNICILSLWVIAHELGIKPISFGDKVCLNVKDIHLMNQNTFTVLQAMMMGKFPFCSHKIGFLCLFLSVTYIDIVTYWPCNSTLMILNYSNACIKLTFLYVFLVMCGSSDGNVGLLVHHFGLINMLCCKSLQTFCCIKPSPWYFPNLN